MTVADMLRGYSTDVSEIFRPGGAERALEWTTINVNKYAAILAKLVDAPAAVTAAASPSSIGRDLADLIATLEADAAAYSAEINAKINEIHRGIETLAERPVLPWSPPPALDWARYDEARSYFDDAVVRLGRLRGAS